MSSPVGRQINPRDIVTPLPPTRRNIGVAEIVESEFTDIASAAIGGGNTGIEQPFQVGSTPTRLISATIKNETRPLADPRPAYIRTSNQKGGSGISHGVKHASSYNDAYWRFDPPILIKPGGIIALLHNCGDNDSVGFQIETDHPVKIMAKVIT